MFGRVRHFAPWLLSAVLCGWSLNARAASSGLAIVNVQKVVNASADWKDMMASLEKTLKSMQAALETKKSELQDKRAKLEAQKAVSSGAALRTQESELEQQEQALVQQFVASQQKLTMAEGRVKAAMIRRIQEVVADLAEKGGITFVFDLGDDSAPNVLYADKKLDMTDRVIKAYQTYFKGKPLDVKLDDLLKP